MDNLITYCADVGSVRRGNFGWARVTTDHEPAVTGTDIAVLAAAISDDLARGAKIAFGLECPLFLPVPTAEALLGSARSGEGNRAWSAGAGSGALATGLVQAAWILSRIRERQPEATVTLSWPEFSASGGLFLWEAFVSGTAKGTSHIEDAELGARAFALAVESGGPESCISAERPFSLIGAALVWSGLSSDPSVLHHAPLVVRA